LKPCPFCCNVPSINHIEPHTHSAALKRMGIPDHPGSVVIECGCGAGLLDDTLAAVAARWNLRLYSPSEPPPPPYTMNGPDDSQELRDARYMVGMLIAEAGGRVVLRTSTMVRFDPRSELHTFDDPVSGNRILELRIPVTKAD
jgi:hypothetical protein